MSTTIFSQQLPDIEVVTVPISQIYVSEYGYIVEYKTSNLYKDTIYLPRSWISGDDREIVVKFRNLFLNLDTHTMKLIYTNKKLDEIVVYLTKDFLNIDIPIYPYPLDESQFENPVILIR